MAKFKRYDPRNKKVDKIKKNIYDNKFPKMKSFDKKEKQQNWGYMNNDDGENFSSY